MSLDTRLVDMIAEHITFEGVLLEVSGPKFPVEIRMSDDGDRMWINIGLACIARFSRLETAKVDLHLPREAILQGFLRLVQEVSEEREITVQEAAGEMFMEAVNEYNSNPT